jgi:hypothetical protein
VAVLAVTSCTHEAVQEVAVTPTVEEPSPSPSTLTPGPASGFERFQSDLGYTAEIPHDWTTVPDFRYPGQSGEQVTNMFQAPDGVDPTQPSGVANITVAVHSAGGLTFEEMTSATAIIVTREYPDARIERTGLAGGPAWVAYFTKPGGSSEGGRDYAILVTVIDDNSWTITLTTAAGLREKYLPVFEHFCQTFSLSPK